MQYLRFLHITSFPKPMLGMWRLPELTIRWVVVAKRDGAEVEKSSPCYTHVMLGEGARLFDISLILWVHGRPPFTSPKLTRVYQTTLIPSTRITKNITKSPLTCTCSHVYMCARAHMRTYARMHPRGQTSEIEYSQRRPLSSIPQRRYPRHFL